MFRILLPLLLFVGVLAADQPLLLQKPTVNKTHIVFSYAGDLWSVPREGGEAVRLTAGTGVETAPIFSPDGSLIAFQGEYEGNQDVYVMPAEGGVPKRLTYHPAADSPVGWSPDGKQILFRSNRTNYSRITQLFTISMDGGFPAPVDLPMAYDGSFSADSSKLAYMPISPAFESWKRYRGGETTSIWLVNLADAKVEKIPRENSNDFNPIWLGEKVYFLSDRAGSVSLFSYDTVTRKVTALVHNDGYDMKSASAGPGAIVYEQFGSIHLFDLKSGKAKQVDITVSGDIPSLRPSFEKVASRISNASLSPTGARAVFEARGEIFSVPAEKGDVRNLTNTSGVAERSPAWSPDGKQIAYFSDESGEYQLHLRAQDGMGDVQKIGLGTPPAFYYDPVWSPDSKKIAYEDSQRQLWYIDLADKKPVRMDKDTYFTPQRGLNPDWSPDSKWIAYTKILKNHLRAVFLYSLADGQPHQASDGMSDAEFAKFDKNGKYLYFTASTNVGLTTAWLDMSGDERPTSSSVYVAVLRKEDASPLAPESDEEKGEAKEAKTAEGESKKPDAGIQNSESIYGTRREELRRSFQPRRLRSGVTRGGQAKTVVAVGGILSREIGVQVDIIQQADAVGSLRCFELLKIVLDKRRAAVRFSIDRIAPWPVAGARRRRTPSRLDILLGVEVSPPIIHHGSAHLRRRIDGLDGQCGSNAAVGHFVISEGQRVHVQII